MSQYIALKKRKRTSSPTETASTTQKSAKTTEPGANDIAGQVYTLKALVPENGTCPFEDWLKSIKDTTTKQRIQSRLDIVERGNLGDHSSVGEGVSELRLMFGAGHRIYYSCIENTLVVLLVGGDKSTQSKDIVRAQKLWKDNKDDPQRYKRDVRR